MYQIRSKIHMFQDLNSESFMVLDSEEEIYIWTGSQVDVKENENRDKKLTCFSVLEVS